MFLTKKWCRRIKAPKCADGHKKQKYTNKKEPASPTVCLDSIFITGAIKVHENRDVAVTNLPVAFLHASMENEDKVIMVMEGWLAELMVIMEP